MITVGNDTEIIHNNKNTNSNNNIINQTSVNNYDDGW